MRANGHGFKRIERFQTIGTTPKRRTNWRFLASGTGKPFVTRHFRHPGQSPRLDQPTPTVEQDERRDNSNPERLYVNRKYNQPGNAGEAYENGHHKAPDTANPKPKERSKNLPAIQWINGEQVKDKQTVVDEANRSDQGKGVGSSFTPSGTPKNDHQCQDRRQHHVDQRSGRDTPKRRAGTGRRGDIGNASKWPEHNLLRPASNLAASQSMPELVKQDDAEQSQILDDVPRQRGVVRAPDIDFVRSNYKPRPVQIQIDPNNAE
jgi:hypothetical protein